MKNSKITLTNICLVAGVALFLLSGCGGTGTNNDTLKSASGTSVNPNDNSAACNCSSETPFTIIENGILINSGLAGDLTLNYLNYQNNLRGRTELDIENDYVRGGFIKKADLIALINSLPAEEENVRFDFAMAGSNVEFEGDEKPFAKTFLIFHGGNQNPCNYTNLPPSGGSENLFYRTGGFCPPRCDSGSFTMLNESYLKYLAKLKAGSIKVNEQVKKIQEKSK